MPIRATLPFLGRDAAHVQIGDTLSHDERVVDDEVAAVGGLIDGARGSFGPGGCQIRGPELI